ncbi:MULTISPECIES: ATP-binding protein [Halomicrobium]|uniref:Magnesium chelatase n=2 Tax=Halomicrobium mukohataei TaxID=57705 RepID=C7P4F2_HALMD|nr:MULTISPECIES: ATP-binding protein [Halomicrobium]ACV47974.1 Magnesium chelatase [Halomicrobium mukohataei DSM 12286]QCD66411.1 VWA domain-containing protein [Halomicrobium mukohataei]QFR21216.1 VWA domain-containing protein [Halomicrobium sp. ZPS1]
MIDFGGGKKASPGRAGELGFADIVGQAELKEALLTVAANDDLDGLLIQGEKGTAKSTAVRALAALLPDQTAVADCPYGCPPDEPDRQCEDCRERTDPPTEQRPVPLVTLPLGATRERVVGTLSVADALAGDYEFDPGLLARANRGILYVDEVNLLDDHLVDVLLDAAASGTNRVERDGVSVAHPADFTLVGTMNPEEGELRPQLRDRFALQATVTGADDLDDRVAIIEQALADGDDGDRRADVPDDERRAQLCEARAGLSAVTLSPEFTTEIAELCRDAGVDGHRADIATARAARTLAALDGRVKVLESDVRRAAAMALPHRLRSRPFEDEPDASELLDDHFDDESGGDGESERDETEADADGDGDQSEADGEGGDDADGDTADEESGGDTPDGDDGGQTRQPAADDGGDDAPSPPPGSEAGDAGEDSGEAERGEDESGGGESDERTGGTPLVPGQSPTPVGESDAPDLSAPEAVAEGRAASGRGSVAPAVDGEGARVRTQRANSDRQIDAAASVRAATARGGSGVESRDLRQSVRERDSAVLVVFAVDASASMRPAMRAAKGTVLELLKDAYQERDEVAFVTFAGEGADVLLPPTDSVTLAARHLKDLPTGDRTPLPAGLCAAGDVIRRADPAASVVVLVTDGRANVADGSPTEETRDAAREIAARGSSVVVVDAGDDGDTGLTGLIADETDGRRVPLDALSAERIDAAAGAARTNEI